MRYHYDVKIGVTHLKTKATAAATFLVFGAIGLSSVLALSPALVKADSSNIDFEAPTYTLGSISGQDGWTKTGNFDAAVSTNTSGSSTFGNQSFRISDAVTGDGFGDQTFAKPLAEAVGEIDSTNAGSPVGTLQRYFVMQFDIASATPATQQVGMHTSVSPDRGDGSRMSYLRFEDGAAGLDVYFDDVQGTSNPANFVETQIANGLDRTVPHNVKLAMETLDGASNDVVKVWIDGVLVHTGTSWENYYRFDSESSAEQSPRIVKTVLFRESGTANPSHLNGGFLFDNLNTQSLTTPTVSAPTITSPSNNTTLTSAQLTKIDWSDSTGTFIPPVMYQYRSYHDVGYSSLAYDSGATLTASEIPTPNTPNGDYYVQVRAVDTFGNMSAWSNDASNPYKLTVADVPALTSPKTVDACKNNGWKNFNNPTFKNQGDCVSWVQHNVLVNGTPAKNR